ncbi:MAG: zinc ribbon domain-containing protein [SAR86 cluster bacterium]|jgi:putative FmdB family regulatory protein|nr:zinc ribbon domain-containing protein [SAR86 cluster bacterium]
MPIYEYECQECDSTFEKIMSISAPLPQECPSCSKRGYIKKLVSAPSFRLKGSGWYETDFKTGKKKNLSKDDNEKKSSTTKSTTEKSAKKDKSKEDKN